MSAKRRKKRAKNKAKRDRQEVTNLIHSLEWLIKDAEKEKQSTELLKEGKKE